MPVTEVRRVDVEDWAQVRTVRLAALADAPYAFASTWEREAAGDQAFWRERMHGTAWFIAWHGDTPTGIVAGLGAKDGQADERHIVAMWVAPVARGTGVATELLTALLEWARADGAAALVLWVADGNLRARRFYERFGFRGTGTRQPLPSDPTVGEERMRLLL